MKANSLRLRLFFAGAISIALALGLSGVGLRMLFERHAERQMATDLAIVLDELVGGLDREADGRLVAGNEPVDPRFDRPLSGLYWQVTGQPNGFVARSRSLWDAELRLPTDELSEGALHRHRIAGPGDSVLLALERRIILPARLGGVAVRAVVARDAADIVEATRTFTGDLAPFIGVVALFLITASGLQVAVGLAPLKAVRARLAAIRSGTADRLGSAFPEEVQALVGEFDALLDAREKQIVMARSRAADLAHGLKTPLQVLAGDVERLRARGDAAFADDLASVGETMRRHVERELARARRVAGSTDPAARVREVVERVVRVVGRTPAGEALDWVIDVPNELSARIQPEDLAEILGNLLENAARHARDQVVVRADREGREAVITVVDDGPGIPPGRIDDAIRRGGRLDESGTGTGLGLAIVSDAAVAWDGSFALGPTNPGAMTATVRLPLTRA